VRNSFFAASYESEEDPTVASDSPPEPLPPVTVFIESTGYMFNVAVIAKDFTKYVFGASTVKV
jgi:hypothetical protein